MILSNKQNVLIEFIVSQRRRISLPCISFVTPKSLQKGLMGVKRMSRSIGAFFIFEKSGYNSAWMEKTYLPLDLVWISSEGIVCEIVEGARPFDRTSLGGTVSSKYLIEVVAGWVSRNEIRKGLRVKVSKLLLDEQKRIEK